MIRCRLEIARGPFRLACELEAPRGVTVLFGPSGAGKSTLLRCLAGLERPDAGRIEVDGEVWLDERRCLPAHRRAVGLVFQESVLFPRRTVRGNLEYGWERAGRPGGREAVLAMVRAMGLSGLSDRAPATLSGGERQRVALGRALLRSPRVLLLDEPLGALDETARSGLLSFLEEHLTRLEIPVVYVTHSLEEALRLADRVVTLAEGKIREQGDVVTMAPRLGAGDRTGVVLDVHGLEREGDLLSLATDVGRFRASPSAAPSQRPPRRIRILARDVSLALSRPRDTSILNLFPGRVEEIREEGAEPLLSIRCGTGLLLSRVTAYSRRALGLEPGREVWAQVKGVAILGTVGRRDGRAAEGGS